MQCYSSSTVHRPVVFGCCSISAQANGSVMAAQCHRSRTLHRPVDPLVAAASICSVLQHVSVPVVAVPVAATGCAAYQHAHDAPSTAQLSVAQLLV